MQTNERLVRLCCVRNMIEARTIRQVLADHAIPCALVGPCKSPSPSTTRVSAPDRGKASVTDSIDQQITIIAWEDDFDRANAALQLHWKPPAKPTSPQR